MARKIICDGCKKELKLSEVVKAKINCYYGYPEPIYYKELDFCEACYQKFIKQIKSIDVCSDGMLNN